MPGRYTNQGHWEPGKSISRFDGISKTLWSCDDNYMRRLSDSPRKIKLYSNASVYYAEGYGFWVSHEDPFGAFGAYLDGRWKPLTFEHNEIDYSSYLTNSGVSGRLRCQRPDQLWQRMLLPEIYHSPAIAKDPTHGGLSGDLPIFLALIALSMSREDLITNMGDMYRQGQWQVHGLPHRRKYEIMQDSPHIC